MLSAASCPFPLNSAAASRWREVQTLCRRVHVLRVTGKSAEAGELESGALSESVAALRSCSTVTQAQLDGLFAAEEERVTSARLLAEILLPMLTESWAAFSRVLASQAPGSSPSGSPARDFTPAAANVAPHETAPATRETTPGLPGIADFIDEMLSQERGPRGSRRSA
jgi:hypothetical protein